MLRVLPRILRILRHELGLCFFLDLSEANAFHLLFFVTVKRVLFCLFNYQRSYYQDLLIDFITLHYVVTTAYSALLLKRDPDDPSHSFTPVINNMDRPTITLSNFFTSQ